MQRVWPFIWVGLVVGAWLASPWLVRWVVGGGEKVGTFGDSFGALTSLFTGLAFVGLIITLRQQKAQIAMQREDLKLQRDEMKAARAELSGQKEQMELQNQSLKQQMFEQTFFSLLSALGRFISEMKSRPSTGEPPNEGRDRLVWMAKSIYSGLGRAADQEKSIIFDFRERRENFQDEIGPFIRQLLSVLIFIDTSEIQDKERYVDFLQVQMPDGAFVLVVFECCLPDQAELRRLCDKYDFLRYQPTTSDWRMLPSIVEKMNVEAKELSG
jgi:hypothetical protein